ncbi:MAG: hypothetical protein ACI86H_002065 [bacterium]|jgi:hypothetical protein
MNSIEIKTTNQSIKSHLQKIKPEQALSEYIWNGFDANATTIKIFTNNDLMGGFESIQIIDNGDGINYEELPETFNLFLDSKKKENSSMTIRGEKGRGRLTFFKFCECATWKTWSNQKLFEINIKSSTLNRYNPQEISEIKQQDSGTEVTFRSNLIDFEYFKNTIVPYIQNEFSWLLLAYENFNISINGEPLKIAGHLKSLDEKVFNNETFNIKSTLWDEKPTTEKSRIYFLNSSNIIVYKVPSGFNNKNFYCSSYVRSDWFDNFDSDVDMFTNEKNPNSDTFIEIERFAKNKLDEEYIKRRVDAANSLIEQYTQDGIFPKMTGDNTALNHFHRDQLIVTIKTIFEAEPKVFSNLNIPQKKILIKLIDRIVQSNKVSDLFNVLEGVISLSDESILKMSSLLERTSLENITKTVEYISDRLKIINYFSQIIYDHKKFALEVPHIQKVIENNLWLFGEQYHLLTSEEDKFDQALRNLNVFRDGTTHFNKLTHPDKNKEMDIFAAQRGFKVDDEGKEYYHNIVIELKRPSIKLTDKELDQIKTYKNIIDAEPQFDTESSVWDFILVGNEISNSSHTASNLKAELKSNKIHSEQGLILKDGKIRIYIKTWKQILNDFELRYNELSEKLKLKELEIIKNSPNELTKSIDEINNGG